MRLFALFFSIRVSVCTEAQDAERIELRLEMFEAMKPHFEEGNFVATLDALNGDDFILFYEAAQMEPVREWIERFIHRRIDVSQNERDTIEKVLEVVDMGCRFDPPSLRPRIARLIQSPNLNSPLFKEFVRRTWCNPSDTDDDNLDALGEIGSDFFNEYMVDLIGERDISLGPDIDRNTLLTVMILRWSMGHLHLLEYVYGSRILRGISSNDIESSLALLLTTANESGNSTKYLFTQLRRFRSSLIARKFPWGIGYLFVAFYAKPEVCNDFREAISGVEEFSDWAPLVQEGLEQYREWVCAILDDPLTHRVIIDESGSKIIREIAVLIRESEKTWMFDDLLYLYVSLTPESDESKVAMDFFPMTSVFTVGLKPYVTVVAMVVKASFFNSEWAEAAIEKALVDFSIKESLHRCLFNFSMDGHACQDLRLRAFQNPFAIVASFLTAMDKTAACRAILNENFPICKRVKQLSDFSPEKWIASMVRGLSKNADIRDGIKAGLRYLDNSSRLRTRELTSNSF